MNELFLQSSDMYFQVYFPDVNSLLNELFIDSYFIHI